MNVPSDDHAPDTTFTLPCHPVDVFSTPEEALSSINCFARQHGYAVVIQHTYYDKDKQRRRLKLACDRHGVKRQKCPRPNAKRRLDTSSRRYGYPMALNVVRVLDTSQWKIDYRGLETTHNHPPTSAPSSHPVHRRTDRDSFVIGTIKTDGEIGVRADQTLARLLVERPALSITARDIYNERQRSLLVELKGRSRIDHLLHLLNSAEYTSAFQQDDHGHITHLFFAFNENLEISSKNCDVIIMDCTYKTNGFGMPLLNIIGVSGSNTTLHLAQAFLRGETEVDYQWTLSQLDNRTHSSNLIRASFEYRRVLWPKYDTKQSHRYLIAGWSVLRRAWSALYDWSNTRVIFLSSLAFLAFLRFHWLSLERPSPNIHRFQSGTMSLKSKAKRLTRKELESRLAQYESTAVNQATSNTSCVKQEDIIPEKKVVWTEDMVRILLELWLHRYAAAFQATQSNQQLSVLWKKIALSLNLACSATIPAQSAKSKYHSLKAEYTKIHIQEQSTGNNVDEVIIYPTYWPHLVEFLGDKNGLGHKEFGSSTDLDETIGDETVDIIEQTNTKRLKSEETTSKRGRRVSQTSVADGLAALGQTLAKGLVDAAIATPTQQDEKLDVILNAFQESKRVQDALLENISTSNAIQAELLAFLKQNSGK